MATPAQIAEASSCFRCISDEQAAILYLLGTIAGVTDPAIIARESACMRCIPDFDSAALYLLSTIATNAAAAEGQVTCGVGAPVAEPTHACAIYYDTSNDAVYIWRGGVWALKV